MTTIESHFCPQEMFKEKEAMFEALSLSGLNANLETAKPELWQRCFAQLAYQPVSFTTGMRRYQLTYHRDLGGCCNDISVVLMHEAKPVGLWPLSLHLLNGAYHISSQGLSVQPPLFSTEVGQGIIKQQNSKCLDFLHLFGNKLGIKEIVSRTQFFGEANIGEWHRESLARNARPEIEYDLYLNLSPSWDKIRANFRERYKSLVNVGLRTWQTGVSGADLDEKTWEEFKNLHLEVAGRKTRSDASWLIQYNLVKTNCAFLVWLRNDQKEMVGGGLFDLSPMEGSYSVGAYNRTLFKKPLGHVVQALAIQEMIRRKLKWYRIGVRPFLGNAPQSSPKERSIAHFKEGFASDLFPAYRLKHPLENS